MVLGLTCHKKRLSAMFSRLELLLTKKASLLQLGLGLGLG